ncbi:MAG: hypothetical protein P8I93_03225 [Crocinitomicaceae bacterium]|nr:hypothetical protein [Crocinitomicaceae bacterium]
MKYLFYIPLLGLLFFNSCAVKYNNLNKYATITENGQINTGQIVSKALVTKGGKITESEDLYFRLSVQDYFIKFCESKVTIEEIKPYIQKDNELKSVTLEIEIKEGEWDNCNVPGYVQSRTGRYVVIKRILN